MAKYSVVSGNRSRSNGFGLADHFSDDEWEHLLSSTGNKCLCCGISFDETYATADHVTPLTCGGTNTIDNIQPLCNRCNSRKHQKYIDYRHSAGASRGMALVLRPSTTIDESGYNSRYNKVRLSYRIDEDVAQMIADLAAKHRIEKTLLVEIAIRRLFDDPHVLDAAFPVVPPTTPPPTAPSAR